MAGGGRVHQGSPGGGDGGYLRAVQLVVGKVDGGLRLIRPGVAAGQLRAVMAAHVQKSILWKLGLSR